MIRDLPRVHDSFTKGPPRVQQEPTKRLPSVRQGYIRGSKSVFHSSNGSPRVHQESTKGPCLMIGSPMIKIGPPRVEQGFPNGPHRVHDESTNGRLRVQQGFTKGPPSFHKSFTCTKSSQRVHHGTRVHQRSFKGPPRSIKGSQRDQLHEGLKSTRLRDPKLPAPKY